MKSDHPIILFDGVCNLCNRIVQFVIRHDHKKRFRFASLQGNTGQEILKQYQLPQNDFFSFIMLDGGKIFTRSTAALRLFKNLGGGWKLLYGFMILPRFIRDGFYNWIAHNRYRWFGTREECMVPTEDLKDRFLN